VRDLGTFLPKGLRIAAARAIAREHPTLGRVVNLARYDIALPEAFDDDFAALVERSKGLAGVKDLLPGAGYDRRRDMTQSSSIGIVSQGGSSSDRVPSQGLASCPKPLATIVVDLAIGPGIRLFDALAHIFNTSDTEARCLSIGRRDCLVAQNGRIRTPLED
jgi:hypothetical protein